MSPITTDPLTTPILMSWGFFCLVSIVAGAYALLLRRENRVLRRRLEKHRTVAQHMLSEKDAGLKAEEARAHTLTGENEALRMQSLYLRRRINEMLRRKLESEDAWLREKGEFQRKYENASQSLARQFQEMSDIKARLYATESRRDHLAKDNEALKAVKEQYESVVLELRDRLSEYHHRLHSGRYLDFLVHYPPDPDHDDFTETGSESSERIRLAGGRRLSSFFYHMATVSSAIPGRATAALALVCIGTCALLYSSQRRLSDLRLAEQDQWRAEKEKEVVEKDTEIVALRQANQDLRRQLVDLNRSNEGLTGRILEMEEEAREREARLILPLASANEGLQQQLVVLRQSNEDLLHCLAQAKDELGRTQAEVERVSFGGKELYEHYLALVEMQANQAEEIEQLRASLRSAEAESKLKDARILHLSKAQERLLTTEREKWQREVLELNDRLSECYRRLRSANGDDNAFGGKDRAYNFPNDSDPPPYRSPPVHSGPGRMQT